MSLYAMSFDEFADHMKEAEADLSRDGNVTTATFFFLGRTVVAGTYDHTTERADLPFC